MVKRRSIKIDILPTAKSDLQEIVDFIAQGSHKYAKLEKQLIINAISQLFDFPDLGKPFDYRSIDARQLVFKNYLIIYRYKTEDVLEILTVHHHARSISNNPAFTDED
ncbi:MAG: type toxin-antitoxin system RelE/ParE family toxin [Mucilaginibacter sp.]|uniref:type II toxin-antitoxin system RelE/ParE family toxin n=1 Tax=Mucilaginibacter sp. TaxID=1882438 RepID=UPI00260839E9|nr:type II toxin-antitoxin system RelE/ParE family toxin [Mucilaginibacter sp.]MDB5003187.1 type toxin-antitoxin system RelE/ParE family toxin [Mucilaginibacter sp.]